MPRMTKILDICTLDALKACAYSCEMPYTGFKKDEFVHMLSKGASAGDILDGLDKTTLSGICRKCELPTTGTKEVLMERIQDRLDWPPANAGKTVRQKCMMCEHTHDPSKMNRHHFVPKGLGKLLLCANCHSLLERHNREAKRKKGQDLDLEQRNRVFWQTKRDEMDGMHGRR